MTKLHGLLGDLSLCLGPSEAWTANSRNASGPPSQNLFQIALPMQHRDHLQRDRFGPADDHITGKFRDGPKTHRLRRYVLPLASHKGMLRQPATCGDDFHFHPVGGFPAVFRDKPPDGIEVFSRLRREPKGRIHPCGFSRSARRFLNISMAASPSINSPRSACAKPISIWAATDRAVQPSSLRAEAARE